LKSDANAREKHFRRSSRVALEDVKMIFAVGGGFGKMEAFFVQAQSRRRVGINQNLPLWRNCHFGARAHNRLRKGLRVFLIVLVSQWVE